MTLSLQEIEALRDRAERLNARGSERQALRGMAETALCPITAISQSLASKPEGWS